MRIATWNIERLKHISEKNTIEKLCADLDADILVLTEADNRISLDYEYVYETDLLPASFETASGRVIEYKESERRVVIYSKYPCIRGFDTKDRNTSVALELDTPVGNVVLYGVIIGILGNRDANFNVELANTVSDIQTLSQYGFLVVCGDFNCSFSDGYYFTKYGRDTLQKVFDNCGMNITTAECTECIDHIAVSKNLLRENTATVYEWNQNKNLSDHKGIMITI